jgi:hypothetical protein
VDQIFFLLFFFLLCVVGDGGSLSDAHPSFWMGFLVTLVPAGHLPGYLATGWFELVRQNGLAGNRENTVCKNYRSITSIRGAMCTPKGGVTFSRAAAATCVNSAVPRATLSIGPVLVGSK